jgi:hypothetical protein
MTGNGRMFPVTVSCFFPKENTFAVNFGFFISAYCNRITHGVLYARAQETSSAQYILQQYLAASGGQRLLSSIRNSYAMGKVRMVATEFEAGGRVVRNRMAAQRAEPGRFVLWQMAPEMWYMELAVGGSKVHAGCNGKLVWRHTPWLGAHSAKGPVRPLRRALQVSHSTSVRPRTLRVPSVFQRNVKSE